MPVRKGAPSWNTEDVIMCCLTGLLHTAELDGRWVSSNGGIVISRGQTEKRNTLGKQPAKLPYRPSLIIADWTWRWLHSEYLRLTLWTVWISQSDHRVWDRLPLQTKCSVNIGSGVRIVPWRMWNWRPPAWYRASVIWGSGATRIFH
jgi:hypothetical protein